MTTKTASSWNPQPVGTGNQTLSTTQIASNLVDQLGNFLVDQAGNFLVTGTNVPQNKIAISWSDTGA